MIKPKILTICLATALMAPLSGCQNLQQFIGMKPSDSELQAQAREREAQQAREREEQQARERAAQQAREREAQLAREREVQQQAYERTARQAYEREEHLRQAKEPSRHKEASGTIGEKDIALIHDYYAQGHQIGKTAGKITKLRKGEAYPFGHTWTPLPTDLEFRLSPLPKGHVWALVGTEIGIIDIRSRVVADVLENIRGEAKAPAPKAAEVKPAAAPAPAPKAAEDKPAAAPAPAPKAAEVKPAAAPAPAPKAAEVKPAAAPAPAPKAAEVKPVEAPAPAAKAETAPQPKSVSKVFTPDDVSAIRSYFKQGNPIGKTAGRIAKLRRGEPYPFGNTWRPLPADLEARLSPLPSGHIHVLVGTEVGIMEIRSRAVVDLVDALGA